MYKDDPQLEARKVAREQQHQADFIESMSTRDFLIARTKETIEVPFFVGGAQCVVQIRARLSRGEAERHKEMFSRWERALAGDEHAFDDAEDVIASFLAYITEDPQLDRDFWKSNTIDDGLVNQILLAYFSEPVRRVQQIRKFRGV
jgi:hypothetical protein